MKKRTKISIISSIIIVILLLGGLLISTGGKRTDVYLRNYFISEDGNTMTLDVSVVSSMGYIRSIKVKQGGDNKYITFYSTFGLNSTLGAKSKFEIEINPYCDEIYFYKGDGGYKLVLEKDRDTNEWSEVKE